MNKFKKLDQDTERLIKATAKVMDKKTDQTATKIKRALDEAFSNWAKDGLLTSDEMRKYRRSSKLDKAITDIIKDGRSITDDEIKKLTQAAAKETVHICLMNKKKIRVRAIKKKIDLDEIINDTVAGRHWKERTQHISANLTYDILSQVKKGIANGEPYHQMAKSIDRVMGAYKGRPEVIARTETHRIIEHTKHQAMTEVNKEIKQYKIWHSVGDERVRDSHAQMDGQKVPIDQPFIFPSGAQAMYPGGSGVAGEDINCRCFVEYVDEVDIQEESEDQADEVVEKTEKTGYKEDKKEESGEKEYKIEKLGKVLGEDDKKEFQEILKNCPNEDIQRLYNDYADDLGEISRRDGGGYYKPSDKSMVVGFPIRYGAKDQQHKYSTISHEYGHFFDFTIKNPKLNHKEVEAIEKVAGKAFTQRKSASCSDEFLAALRKDKAALKAMGFSKLNEDLYGVDASAGVQDAIDGMFIGQKHRIGWGHGESYYNLQFNTIKAGERFYKEDFQSAIKDKLTELGFEKVSKAKVKEYIRDYKTAAEAWANITSAVTTNSDELKYVKKYLPNSYEALIEIMKGMTR